MQIPVEVTFRHLAHSDSIEALVRELAGKLDHYCDHVDSCRVAIERPQAHQDSGRGFRVRLDITMPPGHEIVVTREAGEGELHDTLPYTVREAFQVAYRQVRKLSEKQNGLTKHHPDQQVDGVVIKLFEDYGFIEALDGREIYFHRNSIRGKRHFDELRIGSGVAFTEALGDEGPQASTVRVVDSRGGRHEAPVGELSA